jgi:hypothetical protein
MKKTYMFLGVIFAAFLIFGCISGGSAWPGGEGVVKTGPGVIEERLDAGSNPSYAPGTDQFDRMVIKTGNAEVEVQSGTLKEKYLALKDIIASYGGEITYSSYFETPNEKYYLITARLNPQKFDELGLKLADIGTIKSLTGQTEDVTMRYMDVNAKLENLKASRERVLMLYNRTDNISEILQIENELKRLQYEIDLATQEKLYYERQAAKATMTIKLVEPAPAVDQTLFTPLGQLLNIFFGGLVFSATVVVGLLGFLIPIAIVLALGYAAIKIVFFKKR